MKLFQGTVLPVSVMAGTVLVVTGLPVLASVSAECRQEAKDYGIPSEQLEDYVSGCVMSRGGDYAPDPAVQDYAAPPEGEVGNDTGMDGDYIPDPAVQDYAVPQDGDSGNDALQ
jgi:hypothetical protein